MSEGLDMDRLVTKACLAAYRADPSVSISDVAMAAALGAVLSSLREIDRLLQKGRTRLNVPTAVAERATEIILSQGRPLQRGTLVRLIEESGIPIISKDKPRYLGTILWRRRDIFEHIEGRGYWLEGKPLPPLHAGDQVRIELPRTAHERNGTPVNAHD